MKGVRCVDVAVWVGSRGTCGLKYVFRVHTRSDSIDVSDDTPTTEQAPENIEA